MYLTRLTLRSFRNYRELDLDLPPGLSIFSGANAQGKTNLLEAVYTLALTRSHRAENERDVVQMAAPDEVAYTRVLGAARRRDGAETRVQIDMALNPVGSASGATFQKRIRVDGIPRPATEAIGSIAAVHFSVEDLGLVTGPPAGHRRYLDILLSQMDRPYLRALQRYQKVLAQRNSLMRRIREGQAGTDELPFWDGELCGLGARIVVERRRAVDALAPLALEAHARLAPTGESLDLQYRPTVDPQGEEVEPTAERLAGRLRELRSREVQLGQTLVGPHRDDLAFLVGGVDVGRYGSRGQVRTVALALRLAEARFLADALGDEPILLLDDVLSELDGARQREVLGAALAAEQALMTVVDTTLYPQGAGRVAASFRVERGTVAPLALGNEWAPEDNGGAEAEDGP